MQQKPEPKSIVILNLVNNVPMAIVMSLTAPILMGMPLVPASVCANITIAFVLACAINLIFPIPRIAVGVPRALKLNLYNVRQVPAFLFAFLGTFVPLYLVCFVVP